MILVLRCQRYNISDLKKRFHFISLSLTEIIKTKLNALYFFRLEKKAWLPSDAPYCVLEYSGSNSFNIEEMHKDIGYTIF